MEELIFYRCSKHGIQRPSGVPCPGCKREKEDSMSDSYRMSDPDPGAPCQPKKHNFAQNGKCWHCGHTRDDLIRAAQQLLDHHKKRDRYCGDCGEQLPSGHPHGYCPSREDSGYG